MRDDKMSFGQEVITTTEGQERAQDHTPPLAGTGETIAVLAIGTQDGHEMRKAIGEVKPGAKVVLVTEQRQIEGVRATEFVMTGPFRSQRSIRLLLAAERATQR